MTTLHPLAQDYLRRLDAAAASAQLPADRQRELTADLTEHLRTALPPGASEAQARQALDALGTPEQAVAAASDDLPPVTATGAPTRDWVAFALLLGWPALLVFPPLAFVAWVAALVLLMIGRRWTATDKALGLVPLGVPLAVVLLGAFAWATCSSVDGASSGCDPQLPMLGPIPVGLIAVIALVAADIYVLVRLARRLR